MPKHHQCIIHAVDWILLQPDATTVQHKEAISKKKLLKKGEGGWSQQKEILGWIWDTGQGTLELTKWCSNWILDIFEELHHGPPSQRICIQCHIVLMVNPTDDLMNSDLEQAKSLAHADVVMLLFNLRELTLASLNNNVAAVT